MFKTILVGHDGSPQGAAAVDLARALAAEDASVELAVVTPTTLVPTLAGAWDFAIEDDARATLAAAVERATRTAPTAGRLLRASSPARGLTARAEELDADLVVLGSTHRGAAGRIILGTTAQRLLQGAPCTVAIAPKEQLTDRIRHVGVAYDGSPEADAALARAYAIAEELGAAVTIYTVAEAFHGPAALGAGYGIAAMDESATAIACTLAQGAAERAPEGVHPATVVLRGQPAASIAEAADGIVDLMIMGSRGYGPLRRVLLGSMSAGLIDRVHVPVLVVARPAVDHDLVAAAPALTAS